MEVICNKRASFKWSLNEPTKRNTMNNNHLTGPARVFELVLTMVKWDNPLILSLVEERGLSL